MWTKSLREELRVVNLHTTLIEWANKNWKPFSYWGWVIDWDIRDRIYQNQKLEPVFYPDGILTDAIWMAWVGEPNLCVAFVHNDQVHTTPVPFQSNHADMIAAIETARKATP